MHATRKRLLSPLIRNERGQSSVFVALTALVFIAFLPFSMLCKVPNVYAGKISLYHKEGSTLFAKDGAVLIHEEVLSDVVSRINHDPKITGLEISVTCPVNGGGKDLARKRSETLERFFKQRLHRFLPLQLFSLEQKAIEGYDPETTRKMLEKMGQQVSQTTMDYYNFWDVVDIAGTGGTEISDDSIFYEIDEKISKLPAADPHIAILRQYRKILQTMAELDETLPHYPNSDPFEPHPPDVDTGEPGWGPMIVGGELRVARLDYAEVTENNLPLHVMAVNLSKEVYNVALAIRREHSQARVPPYDEKNGIKSLQAYHTYIKYSKDTVNVNRFSYQYIVKHEFDPERCRSYGNLAIGLGLMEDMKTYQIRRQFVLEQAALNNFIREHLGLALITEENGYYEMPIRNSLPLVPVLNSPSSYITMEEAVQVLLQGKYEWDVCGFPSLEELDTAGSLEPWGSRK